MFRFPKTKDEVDWRPFMVHRPEALPKFLFPLKNSAPACSPLSQVLPLPVAARLRVRTPGWDHSVQDLLDHVRMLCGFSFP